MYFFSKINFYLKFIGKSLILLSPCRSYQILYFENLKITDTVIEFGVNDIKESFSRLIKDIDSSKIFITNKHKSSAKNYLEINLEKKCFVSKKFNNVVIFNVLEHIFDTSNAVKEIKKILKKNGKLILSTPFLYRFHSAPNDYLRFTENYLNKILDKNKFKIMKSTSYGTGPLLVCYSMIFDYIKKIPFLATFLLINAIMFDSLLSVFQKTPMSKIYPICIIIEAKKY